MTRMPRSSSFGPIVSGGRLGKRQKDDVGGRDELVEVEWRNSLIPDARERRKRAWRARGAGRHRRRQRDRRMPREQPHELLPGIAGRAGDRDAGPRGASGGRPLGGAAGLGDWDCYGHSLCLIRKRIFIHSDA
jgi:hypothetical protein